MQAVYDKIRSVARSMATVFITGESGTGKELCAEAVHRLSAPRGPFIALNCGAIPVDLLESEVFGHLRGSFTGAISDKIGAAAAADGGTLFLDEICEMDLNLQTKLLRFLQTSTITPVGRDRPRKVDVRIVCATNRNPLDEVRAGNFREDLYYRLHVVPIHMPPLRARGEDVIEIAERLLADMAQEEGHAFTGLDNEVKRSSAAALARQRAPADQRAAQCRGAQRRSGRHRGHAAARAGLAEDAPDAPLAETARPRPPPVKAAFAGRTLAEIERMVIEDTLRPPRRLGAEGRARTRCRGLDDLSQARELGPKRNAG
jgi:two-component system, repressor protein LuxO